MAFKRYKWLLAVAAMGLVGLVAPKSASADTIFTISGTFGASGFGFDSSSWLSIDTTTGLATDAAIAIDGPSAFQETFTGAPTCAGCIDLSNDYQWTLNGSLGDTLTIANLAGTFINYPGGTTLSAVFGTGLSGGGYYTIATLTDPPGIPTSTPEPSSLLESGIGLLAIVATGFFRKRNSGLVS